MKKLNTFDLVRKNYNINKELEKIENFIFGEKLFIDTTYEHNQPEYFLTELIERYLFDDWKYFDTCLDVEEYYQQANAAIGVDKENSEEVIINFLEVSENMIALYEDNSNYLLKEYKIKHYTDYDK